MAALGRWALLGVSLYAMGVLCRPGYWAWGLAATGLAAVWVLWTLRGQLARDRSVPGHPVHLALLAPLAVAVAHISGALDRGPVDSGWATAGALSVSLVFQGMLLGLAVMLPQSLLSAWAGRWWLAGLAGAAMVAGAVNEWMQADGQPPEAALRVLMLAGSAVLASGAASLLASEGCLCFAAGAVMLMAATATAGGALALDLGGAAPLAFSVGVATLAAVWRRLQRWSVAGAVLMVAGLVLARPWAMPAGRMPWLRAGLLGWGDWAFPLVSGSDPGWGILLAMTGYVGLVGAAAGLLTTLGLLARRWGEAGSGSHPVGAACWLAGAMLATWAMLSPGGLGIPACTVAVGLLWGLAPAMAGAAFRPRSGWILLGVLAAMVGLLGLIRQDGLIGWISLAMGGRDVALHVLAGGMLTLTLCWLTGGQRLRRGLAAAVLVAMGGGLAELLQGLLSQRGSEMQDWRMHAWGCLGAALLYVLTWLWGWGCRRESPIAAA